MPDESNNKEIAISFLNGAASGKPDEAYGTYIGANSRHHNAHFKVGAESLKGGMSEAHEKFPDTRLDVQHVLEEGDLVAVHSRVKHSTDTPDIAVVHIFRFEGDEIAELWDVGMEVLKDSPNENGVF